MANLPEEERGVLASYDRGEWRSIKGLGHAKRRYRQIARATFRKDKRVNIRISAKDLEDLKKRALGEGIPYQTLIASVLHKYTTLHAQW